MSSQICSLCHRPLTADISRRLGLGPICAAKKRLREGDLFSGGVDFTYRILGDVLFIEDLDRGGCSVTNGAGKVLAQIYAELPEARGLPIVYLDSMGRFDVIIPMGGSEAAGISVTFTPGGDTYAMAAKKAKEIAYAH